jgi:hypothetical protein
VKELYLVDIDAWDPQLARVRTLRFSTRGYITEPTDTVPNAHYEPRIDQPINVSRHMFSRGATTGRSTIGFGELILVNNDGALDYIQRLGLDGRRIVAWRTEKENPRYPTDFSVVLIGTMQPPTAGASTVTIALRDKQAEMNVALQPVKYRGDNILPNGLEGTESDLRGKPKPLCYGIVRNIDPPCVNTARLIYQVNDGAVHMVDAVYDRGAPLAKGPDYGSQAEMEANAPLGGAFRAWPAGGYFRLGSMPDGLVTADVTQGSDASQRTAARIFEQLIGRARVVNAWTANIAQLTLATSAGDTVVTSAGDMIKVSGDVSQSDLNKLDEVNSAPLGFWTSTETMIGDVCDIVADTAGAWWGVDREGVFRIQQFIAPARGLAKMTVRAPNLLKPLDQLRTNDPGGGLPVYRQVIRWGRNYAVQTTDVAASVAPVRRAQIGSEWRDFEVTDVSVQERHLLSPEVIRTSLYVYADDAAAETNRRLGLYSSRKDRFELLMRLTDETSMLDLGNIVNIDHDRYGLNIVGSSEGTPFVILGVETDAKAGRLMLNVWGSASGRENVATREGLLLVTNAGVYVVTNSGSQAAAPPVKPPPPPRPAAVDSLEVLPSSGTLEVSETLQLAVIPRDVQGNILNGRTIVWSTSNPLIATVSDTGLVTAVAKTSPPAPLPGGGSYPAPDIFDATFANGNIAPLGSYGGTPVIMPDSLDPAWGNVARLHYASPTGADLNIALIYSLADRGWLKAGDPSLFTRFYINLGTWAAGTSGSSDQRKLTYHTAERDSDDQGRCATLLTLFGYKLRIRQNYYDIVSQSYQGIVEWDVFTFEEARRYRIEEQIQPNSAHGVADGIYRLWVDGVLIREYFGVMFFPTALHYYNTLRFGQQLQTVNTPGNEYRYLGRVAASTQRIGA